MIIWTAVNFVPSFEDAVGCFRSKCRDEINNRSKITTVVTMLYAAVRLRIRNLRAS